MVLQSKKVIMHGMANQDQNIEHFDNSNYDKSKNVSDI
jgi:hypothetical protein